ncbi:MAG: hypothetical protein HY079_01940 [Elusimicrobia bacterium]|nr:hypothetical protein [Elusimicrobiota bacterium]
MNVVVGSGPSGVMAASALLDAGEPVTLADGGAALEPDRRALVARLAGEPVERWDPAVVAGVSGYAFEPGGKVPVKLAFGSRFPYADAELATLSQSGAKCLQSLARGGLSNLWGAAVLPNADAEFADWPVSAAEMAPHYAAAAAALGVAGVRDGLEASFPFHAPPAPPPPLSRQAALALARMDARRDALAAAGLRHGRARLAVKGGACVACGLCLSGCPVGAIWNSADALDALVARGLAYRPGLRVERVTARAGGASVRAVRLDGGGAETLEARRVFLACGPVSTARLVAASLGLHGRPLPLRYQPYFLLPVLASQGAPGTEWERLHTLAQAFVELDDPAVSARTVHLQLYGYDEHVRDALASATRLLGPLRGPVRRALAGRLMFFQGYLHSDEAGPMTLTAAADGSARLEAAAPERARAVVARAARKLTALAPRTGLWPLLPLLKHGVPGEGNHAGGTFPMRARPAELETDRLGRLPALPGVHLVDSSVLPALAATTFTFTVMANARRIAAESVREGA